MLGLSLTSNLKNAQDAELESAHALAVETERSKILEAVLHSERAGINRFKIAVLHFDTQAFEAEVRGKIYSGLWVESNGDRAVVFSDRVLTEAEKNAVVAWMPKPERL